MRVLLSLLSPLLGLAVGTAGALFAVETGWVLFRPSSPPLLLPWPGWREQLAGYSWSDTLILVVGAALATLGLLLVIIAASARRHDVRLIAPADGVTVVTSPRSLARLVGHHVRDQDGVRSASVTAGPRRIRVRATSRLATKAQLRPTLTTRVNDLIGDLPLARTPRLRVIVTVLKDRR